MDFWMQGGGGIWEDRKTVLFITRSIDAEVSVHVELIGENNWWVYGWSDEYVDRDRVGVTLTGAQDGCAAAGNLVAGEGRY